MRPVKSNFTVRRIGRRVARQDDVSAAGEPIAGPPPICPCRDRLDVVSGC
jgi:hypothetical protein